MKIKSLLALATLAAAASAYSQSAIIEITGATAFRAGTLDAIKAAFQASGGNYKIAHDGSTFNGSTRAIFRGDFKCSDDSVLSDVVIRTCFTGSTEGMTALALGDPTQAAPTSGAKDELYFTVASLSAVTANTIQASFSGAQEKAAADFSFSDVQVSSVPTIDGSEFVGGTVGIVTFTMLANDGTTVAPFNGLTNVTPQQFRALFTLGRLPLSFFSGNSADTSSYVYAVGRNDGSGTRVVYTSETGIGASTLLQQFIASTVDSTVSGGTEATGNGIIVTLQQVPASTSSETDLKGIAADTVTSFGTKNQSTIFGNPLVAGNGGYSSGGDLRRIFQYSSQGTNVVSATGGNIDTAKPIALLTCLATADAITAVTGGARALPYNGVAITPAAPLSDADYQAVTQGKYTLWGAEQLYGKDLDATEQSVFDTLFTNIGDVIKTNGTGVPTSDMQVARDVDGGTVNPL